MNCLPDLEDGQVMLAILQRAAGVLGRLVRLETVARKVKGFVQKLIKITLFETFTGSI